MEKKEMARQILEKTSFGKVSKVQLGVLELILSSEEWVSHKDLIAYLKSKADLPKGMNDETARIQLQKSLRALDSKLKDYFSREDQKYNVVKIERVRGKGIRAVKQNSEHPALAHPSKTKPGDEKLMKEILLRFTRLEMTMSQQFGIMAQALRDLKDAIEKK